MKGIWLLPTLNRISLLKEFIAAFKQSEGSTEGLILTDKEDYLANQDGYDSLELPKGWAIYKTNARQMGDKCREIYDLYKDLDWVGILNDDHRPRTLHFDTKLLAQLTGSNILGCNDGPSIDKPWQAPGRLCGAIVFSGSIIRSLGYFFPPGIQHLYSDNAWELLAANAQCGQILMDICVEHDHVYKHKREDETSRLVNDPKSWEADKKAFDDYVQKQLPIDIEKVNAIQPKQGLMIATPFHDGREFYEYGAGILDIGTFCFQNRIHFQKASNINSSLLPHSRNSLVEMFLSSKCQKLLFIDSDQGFTKDNVLHLFQSNKRIIAGITPHKRFPINYNFDPIEEHKKYFKDLCNKGPEDMQSFIKECADPKGEIEVNRVGTGFMMIDRSVFEIMKPHVATYEAFDNQPGKFHHEFFKMGSGKAGDNDNNKYRGEDWYFTELAKKLNIPIFINAHAVVRHHGSWVWQ